MNEMARKIGELVGRERAAMEKRAFGLAWMNRGGAGAAPSPMPGAGQGASKAPGGPGQTKMPSVGSRRPPTRNPSSRPNPWKTPYQPLRQAPPAQPQQQQAPQNAGSMKGDAGFAARQQGGGGGGEAVPATGEPVQPAQPQIPPQRVRALQSFAANNRRRQQAQPAQPARQAQPARPAAARQGSPWSPPPKPPAPRPAVKPPPSQGTAFNQGKTYGSMTEAEKQESMNRLRAANGMPQGPAQAPQLTPEQAYYAARDRYDQLAASHPREQAVTQTSADSFRSNLAGADQRLAPVRNAADEVQRAREAWQNSIPRRR